VSVDRQEPPPASISSKERNAASDEDYTRKVVNCQGLVGVADRKRLRVDRR
jgi:hypothetical protein